LKTLDRGEKEGRRCKTRMNKISKLRGNAKALSPIFATLILIAIAVIAGIVVYMFTSGYIATMTGGGTVGQEKIAIQSASVTGGTFVMFYAQTISGNPVISGIIIKDSSGNYVSTATNILPTTALPVGQLTPVNATTTLLTSGSYTATFTTKAGNNFVSPTFTVP
jgi:flagellin-like protein